MKQPLRLPKLGLTMEEGSIVEWLVRPGDAFRRGQVLFVLETDKAANEIEAQADGVLLEIRHDAGGTVPVGEVIAWIEGAEADALRQEMEETGGAEGEGMVDAGAGLLAVGASGTSGVSGVSRASDSPDVARVADVAESSDAAATSDAQPQRGPQAHSLSSASPAARVIATPYARRLAREAGISLDHIAGSGPEGRIRAADLPSTATASKPSADRDAGGFSEDAGTTVEPSPTQRAAARRLAQVKHGVPHFYAAAEIDAQPLLELHARLRKGAATRITLNDILVAAVGRALRRMPEMDRLWRDERIVALGGADVGIAVHTERGIFVPVLPGAGGLPLAEVATRARALVHRAREGRLAAADMAGGAITVSNAGMHELTWLTPIINPGQSAILGVGSVRETFRPRDGQPVLCREIGLVLACDHRLHDGVTAARFLAALRAVLAAPEQLERAP
ncbi:dihydrolipoamide acetyltransferase family protein [Ramlibacter sp. AN1015]|uniref:dihydrolipoamide acetyltransferase family protein n=1 Tax=Ramlibacter sp. AN1015 TaxID=3133428 RepID=UPI0030BD1714